jgi:CheY-like chemotaxis protein
MKTILVVDDEFDLSCTLRSLLEDEGYRVAVCANGRDALDCIREARPDLVLMDVMIPLLSGFEVLAAMRRAPELAEMPVILMSAIPPGVRREDYGWQAFLQKPFSLNALLRTVNHLIGTATPEVA